MDKLGWVLLPIALGALWVAWRALRGRVPSRQTLNVGSSLLLLGYVAVTAGLGIFWVANQHLPVFDWHYLFGYALVGLVVLHLAFNLRAVVLHLRRRAPAPAAALPGRRPALGWLGFAGAAAAGGLGWFVGWRQGRSELQLAPAARGTAGSAATGAPAGGSAAAADALALVEQFHAWSSHSRTAAIARAPSVAWGDAPPPFKPLPAAEVVPLPPPRARPLPAAAQRLDAAGLGVLLWHTVGVSAVRGGLHLRTAPSSGALFATELYVAARGVDGLAPGLWHYAPQHHALALRRAGRVDDAALGLPGGGAEADAVVLATAVFRRSGRKYGDRAYRYVLADLGHALENLRTSAQALGADGRIAPRFDGGLAAAALGVDEAEEGVLALVAIGPGVGGVAAQGAPAPPPDSAARTALQPGTDAGWAAPPLHGAVSAPLGVTAAVHRATSLRAEPGPLPRPARASAPAAGGGVAGGGAAGPVLPPAGPMPADRLDVIARRRSQRRFAGRALAQAELAALLEAMSGAPPQLSTAVRIHVLTVEVQDLPPRVWRWDARAHMLRPARTPDRGLLRRARAAALDQDVVGDAAVVFVLTIDRAAFAADPAGAARGYRHAFLEAGMVGERVYLEAGARGLGVCAVGAFYDDEAAALIAVDPAREWVLHFVAVGVPA
jgi:SagB-type dehydrogenase family enzyme